MLFLDTLMGKHPHLTIVTCGSIRFILSKVILNFHKFWSSYYRKIYIELM